MQSFQISGEIDEFVLLENDVVVYRGLKMSHSFLLKSDIGAREFVVELRTDHGTTRAATVTLPSNTAGRSPCA